MGISFIERQGFFLGAVLCLFALCVAFFMQYILLYEPCILCHIQRLIITMLLVCFVLLWAGNKVGFRYTNHVFKTLGIFLVGLGCFVSTRHLLIQANGLPDSGGCTPGLGYFLGQESITLIFEEIFSNLGNCSKVSFSILGLSIPAQLLIIYTGLAVLLVIGKRRGYEERPHNQPTP